MHQVLVDLNVAVRTSLEWIVGSIMSGQFWLGVAVGALLLALGHMILARQRYRVAQVSLNLPFGLGNVTYDATDQDRILAWKLYVQLKTRKAALLFDEVHDVVADVYDSLHELFPITRDLLTSIPLHEAERREGVADLILRVLNDGLRPHLTKWQASFRRWWEQAIELPENKGKNPQEIQRQYSDYDALVQGLKEMNSELSKYAEDLLAIVQASTWRAKGVDREERVVPEPPHPFTPSPVQSQETKLGARAETTVVEQEGGPA